MSGSHKVLRSKGLGAIDSNNSWSELVQKNSLLYEVKNSYRQKRYTRKLYLCVCISKNAKQEASNKKNKACMLLYLIEEKMT